MYIHTYISIYRFKTWLQGCTVSYAAVCDIVKSSMTLSMKHCIAHYGHTQQCVPLQLHAL